MFKLLFEIAFLIFLMIVLYIQFSQSKENAKINEVNKREITDEEFELLRKFFKRKIIYFVFETIFFFMLLIILILLMANDYSLMMIQELINGNTFNVDIILEALIFILLLSVIITTASLNIKIFTIMKDKNDITVCEGFCVQTRSIVQKNRKTVKYATEITDAEDYSKVILNLRPEKDKFIIEKLINPNDRIFVFALDNEVFIMCRNTLFFKNELYSQELYKQKKAKERAKNTVLNV